MNLFGKKKDEQEEDEEELKEKKKRVSPTPAKRNEPKDPTRWLPLLFLLISLFVSYLSWAAF